MTASAEARRFDGPTCRVCGTALTAEAVFCNSCWDGQHCIVCGVVLTRDSVWCDCHGPNVAELAREKTREAERPARYVDNDIVRRNLRNFGIEIAEYRVSKGRPRMSEKQMKAAMLFCARGMTSLVRFIRDCTTPGTRERAELCALVHRVVAEEARRLVTDYRTYDCGIAALKQRAREIGTPAAC